MTGNKEENENPKPKKRTSAKTDEPLGQDFPIIGIGASAGGLAAFEAFFSGLPADNAPGMAFVLVQHLAPDRDNRHGPGEQWGRPTP